MHTPISGVKKITHSQYEFSFDHNDWKLDPATKNPETLAVELNQSLSEIIGCHVFRRDVYYSFLEVLKKKQVTGEGPKSVLLNVLSCIYGTPEDMGSLD